MTRTAGDPDHVVYVCTDPGVPVFGWKGCSVHVQSVLQELVSRGARVDLIASRTGGAAPPGLEHVRVHELGRPRATDAAEAERRLIELDGRAAALVSDLLAKQAGDRARLVYQRYSLFSSQVMGTAASSGVPGVLEVNAPLVQEQAEHRVLVDADLARAMTAQALRAAVLAYAVSGPVARWAQDLAGGGTSVPVVANGVDVRRFSGVAREHAAGTAPVTVAFVGTFRPWHGVDLLVMAAARFQPGQVRLLLVGDGPQLEPVLQRAHSSGVEVQAVGAVDPSRIPALLATADIAAAPYPAASAYFSPLKVLEYLAAGLPTVAGAVSNLGTLLRDGEEVLLVPPGDIDALTAALRRLVEDPALRGALGRAGRAAAVHRLTWRAVVDTVLEQTADRTRALQGTSAAAAS